MILCGMHRRSLTELRKFKRLFGSLLVRFGGHAMAASVTVNAENLEKFRELFAQVAG
jgi:single-stranded DNA-specific DHH superfamily exonuclease